MTATLHEIRRRATRAEVVVVTYPHILPASDTCPALGLTSAQAALMRTVGDHLAKVMRATAKEAGATLVDAAALSTGHDACGAEPWVNGFKPAIGGH